MLASSTVGGCKLKKVEGGAARTDVVTRNVLLPITRPTNHPYVAHTARKLKIECWHGQIGWSSSVRGAVNGCHSHGDVVSTRSKLREALCGHGMKVTRIVRKVHLYTCRICSAHPQSHDMSSSGITMCKVDASARCNRPAVTHTAAALSAESGAR